MGWFDIIYRELSTPSSKRHVFSAHGAELSMLRHGPSVRGRIISAPTRANQTRTGLGTGKQAGAIGAAAKSSGSAYPQEQGLLAAHSVPAEQPVFQIVALIKQKHKVSPCGRCSRDSQTVGLSAFLGTFAAGQKYPGASGGEKPPGCRTEIFTCRRI